MPVAPVLMGFILGPLAEVELRRALTISGGDPSILFDGAIPIVIYLFIVVAVGISVVQHLRGIARDRKRDRAAALNHFANAEEESNSSSVG